MKPDFDPEAYAAAAAAALELPLDPAHLPGVAASLRLAARLAAALEHVAEDAGPGA
jgi:hypothetical protein